jgi:hypothetical protein
MAGHTLFAYSLQGPSEPDAEPDADVIDPLTFHGFHSQKPSHHAVAAGTLSNAQCLLHPRVPVACARVFSKPPSCVLRLRCGRPQQDRPPIRELPHDICALCRLIVLCFGPREGCAHAQARPPNDRRAKALMHARELAHIPLSREESAELDRLLSAEPDLRPWELNLT